MGILEKIRTELIADKGDWRNVAEVSDVPYDTLSKIAGRRTENPRIDSVEKLASYYGYELRKKR